MLAVREDHTDAVQAAGLEAHPIFDDLDKLAASMSLSPDEVYVRVLEDDRMLVRDIIAPRLSDTVKRLAPLVENADLIAASRQTIAAPVLAELKGLPYVPLEFQSMMDLSPDDPPWADGFELMVHNPGRLGRLSNTAYLWLVRRVVRRIFGKPIAAVRKDLGLPPSRTTPFFDQDAPSPFRLALYSPLLRRPSERTKAGTRYCGFMFSDGLTDENAPPPDEDLDVFLDAGPAPLIFTLGSFSSTRQRFFEESIKAVQGQNRRAIITTGKLEGLPDVDPEQVLVRDYIPFSKVFHRASCIVHHGGIGTLALAMLHAKPQLIVPIGVDQPDNAARAKRLGVALAIPMKRYRAARAAEAISKLTSTPSYIENAARVAAKIKAEPGPKEAARLLIDAAISHKEDQDYA